MRGFGSTASWRETSHPHPKRTFRPRKGLGNKHAGSFEKAENGLGLEADALAT
jgi:hypothetical protein